MSSLEPILNTASIIVRMGLYTTVLVVAVRRRRWSIAALSLCNFLLAAALLTPSNSDNNLIGIVFAPLYAMVMLGVLERK